MHRISTRLTVLTIAILVLSATAIAAVQWQPINFLISKQIRVTGSFSNAGTTVLTGTTTAGSLNAGATTVTTLGATGRVTTTASAAAVGSGLRVTPGIAPTTPANGDVWITSAGIFARVGGNTLDLVAAVPWASPTAPIGTGAPVAATFTRLTTSAIGQFADADATPSVGTANVWRCYGRGGLTITDLDDPVGVQEVTLLGSFLNEIQTLTVADGAGADTFTVTYAGQTTAAIAWDVSAANMTAALEALSNIDPGDVAVTEAGGVYTVVFQGALAETNVAEMTATPTDCTVTPATTQAGAAANNSTVADGADIQLAGAWVATGGNTLKLVYDTKKSVWREVSRAAA